MNSGKLWLFNHPPAIKKQLPSMLADRLSLLSYNREEFARAIPEYEEAMRRSRHSSELRYISPPDSHKRKSRKRNIVWFNPPFSEHVKSNIDKAFLHLLEKHFPPHHRLHKTYNKNNVKVSYSCMPNLAAIIPRHNKALLTQRTEPANTVLPCNCRTKTSCQTKELCRESSIIYKATLTSDGIAKNYYGCSETEFKNRFYNHNQSFKCRQKCNATELSKAFWRAKDAGRNPVIEWSIAARTTPYYPGARWCNLWLVEKLFILRADPTTMLNKRSELNGKCRHKNKFKLKNLS